MVALATLLILDLAVVPALAAPLANRPPAELFGTHAIYGIAGSGVNSATGNYSQGVSDLDFPVGLLTGAGPTTHSTTPRDRSGGGGRRR